jgi:hypothetical protein
MNRPQVVAAAVRDLVRHFPVRYEHNKPLERPGVNPRADITAVSAGRSAPIR